MLTPSTTVAPSAAAIGPTTSISSALQWKQRSVSLSRYAARSISAVATGVHRSPHSAASARQSASSSPASDGDTAVTAWAASRPSARCATAARNAESAPPLNATTTRPSRPNSTSRAASLASRSTSGLVSTGRSMPRSRLPVLVGATAGSPMTSRRATLDTRWACRRGGTSGDSGCSCTPTWRPFPHGHRSASTPTGTGATWARTSPTSCCIPARWWRCWPITATAGGTSSTTTTSCRCSPTRPSTPRPGRNSRSTRAPATPCWSPNTTTAGRGGTRRTPTARWSPAGHSATSWPTTPRPASATTSCSGRTTRCSTGAIPDTRPRTT